MTLMRLFPFVCLSAGFVWIAPVARGADDISFARDVAPILSRSCAGCHRPEKLKGKLDVTSFTALAKGGKHGHVFVAGDPDKSPLVEQVSGDEPAMPEKGERLTAAEVDVLARWVRQGAKDDSATAPAPAGASSGPTSGATAADGAAPPGPPAPAEPPVYRNAPILSALACSPDGGYVIVAGSNELLVHHADGSGLVARIPSGSPRTTSLVFSPDGHLLASAGGSPGEFGQIQVRSAGDWKPLKNFRVSGDTLFGLSFSPDGQRLAVGCADRTVHVLSAETGKELARFDQCTDWALCTAFSTDGKKLVAAGRDKSVRLFDLDARRQIDSVNDPVEPIYCLARHPSKNEVVAGGAEGAVRVYKTGELKKRSEEHRDRNRVREMERQPGTVNAVAFSADGKWIALASTGEARVYAEGDGHRVASCSGSQGPVFAVAFSPDGKRVFTGGYDGQVRVFDAEHGKMLAAFTPGGGGATR